MASHKKRKTSNATTTAAKAFGATSAAKKSC